MPGIEVAGTIVATGARVERWQPGDRVFGLVAGGGLAEAVAVHEDLVAAVPGGLTEEEAAAVPEAFVVAHDALRQAKTERGETLLVRGSSGSVGSAVVQLGRAAGLRVLASVRSEAAATYVNGLGATPIHESDLDRVWEAIPQGVGVIVDLVGGEAFSDAVGCLRDGGRVDVVGAAGGDQVKFPLRVLMRKRACVKGSVMRRRPRDERISVIAAFAREVVPLLDSGTVAVSVDSLFPATHMEAAMERLKMPGKRGKVLLAFEKEQR